MDAGVVKVLLVSETPHAFSSSQRRLEKNGCQCQFASSKCEVARLLVEEHFDIVLSTRNMRGGNTDSLRAMLAGSHASFFFALPVEEGCLWLPVLRNGKGCFGTPALRPSEFASELDKIVDEIRTDAMTLHAAAVAA
jgi:hypothetical protein